MKESTEASSAKGVMGEDPDSSLKKAQNPADTEVMATEVFLKTVRVVLADDHPLVRQGLRAVLEYSDGLELVAEAGNGVELVELVAEHRPDVVLVDIEMKPMDGLEAVRRIRRKYPEVRALMLSAHQGAHLFEESISAGASGYLSKVIPPDELVKSILAVAAGEANTVYPARHEELTGAHRVKTWESKRSTSGLTPRELDVLKLVAAGKSNKEIAKAMGIGMQTVKTHVAHILAKMGSPDRAGAVAMGFRQGLFD